MEFFPVNSFFTQPTQHPTLMVGRPGKQLEGTSLVRQWMPQFCTAVVLTVLAFTAGQDSAKINAVTSRGRASTRSVFGGQRPDYPNSSMAAAATPSTVERIEAAVASPRHRAITEELVVADPGCDVMVYTMFRTKDGEAIVEEVVAYYLAQGSSSTPPSPSRSQ